MPGHGSTARRSAATRLREFVDPIGNLLSETFHLLGLFAIGAATMWAALLAFSTMITKGQATLEDLLLLFIYLEVGSMVGIYFKTNHLPVRFLIYVGITALTRHMIVVVQRELAARHRGFGPRRRYARHGARGPRRAISRRFTTRPWLIKPTRRRTRKGGVPRAKSPSPCATR